MTHNRPATSAGHHIKNNITMKKTFYRVTEYNANGSGAMVYHLESLTASLGLVPQNYGDCTAQEADGYEHIEIQSFVSNECSLEGWGNQVGEPKFLLAFKEKIKND